MSMCIVSMHLPKCMRTCARTHARTCARIHTHAHTHNCPKQANTYLNGLRGGSLPLLVADKGCPWGPCALGCTELGRLLEDNDSDAAPLSRLVPPCRRLRIGSCNRVGPPPIKRMLKQDIEGGGSSSGCVCVCVCVHVHVCLCVCT